MEAARDDPRHDPVMSVDASSEFAFPVTAPAAPAVMPTLQQENWEEAEWANDPVYCESLPERSSRAKQTRSPASSNNTSVIGATHVNKVRALRPGRPEASLVEKGVNAVTKSKISN